MFDGLCYYKLDGQFRSGSPTEPKDHKQLGKAQWTAGSMCQAKSKAVEDACNQTNKEAGTTGVKNQQT